MSLQVEAGRPTTRLTFTSPILTTSLLQRLAGALQELRRATAPRPLLLRSAHPSVFLAGAHLGEIAGLDAGSSRRYAELGRQVLDLLQRHPSPTAAVVSGTCAGGGFDLVSRVDLVIASEAARFRHPGARRGLVTGWGGTATLRGSLDAATLRRALLAGEGVAARTLVDCGFVLSCTSDPEAAAAEELDRMAGLHPLRLDLWRSLRQRDFVDIIRLFVVHTRR